MIYLDRNEQIFDFESEAEYMYFIREGELTLRSKVNNFKAEDEDFGYSDQ